MVPVHCISRSQEPKIDFLTKNLKNLLVRNHWTDFNMILQKCSFGDPTKIVQAIWIRGKTWPPGGGAFFSLYIYIENFKNLLVRNHWTNFNIILQKCFFGDPLPRLVKPFRFVKKHGRGGAYFPYIIYIENFQNLLVRNNWTDFNVILQKCSFGDPLPRLFKPFGFVKKHGRQGRGLFSLYIYIENFKNLVRNHWTNFSIILQKCSFGDPLPRLLKLFGFIEKHGRQRAGAFFPYISI